MPEVTLTRTQSMLMGITLKRADDLQEQARGLIVGVIREIVKEHDLPTEGLGPVGFRMDEETGQPAALVLPEAAEAIEETEDEAEKVA